MDGASFGSRPRGSDRMPAPHSAPEPMSESNRSGLQSLLANERDMLAKRIADAPATWISIPMWGRVFVAGRRLLRLDRPRRRTR